LLIPKRVAFTVGGLHPPYDSLLAVAPVTAAKERI
jgi:hypothetical protein